MMQLLVRSLRRIFIILCIFGAGTVKAAEIQEFSLLPIFDELGLSEIESVRIPVNSPDDVALNSRVAAQKAQTVKSRPYPIAQFTANSSGHWMALTLKKIAIAKDSPLDTQVILIERVGSQFRIHKRITWELGGHPNELTMIDQRFLRVGWEKSDSGPNGYAVKYSFYDTQIGETIGFLNLNVRTMRAYGPHHYIVEFVGPSGSLEHGVFRFEPEMTKAKELYRFRNSNLARALMHNPVDERTDERAIIEDGKGGVFTQVEIQEAGKWKPKTFFIQNDVVRIEDSSVSGETDQTIRPVIGTLGLTSSYSNGTISIRDRKTLEVIQKWDLNPPRYVRSLERMSDGYLTRYADHPNYGAVYLYDDGRVENLTPPKMRLRHQTPSNGVLLGLGGFDPTTGDVKVYRVSFASRQSDSGKKFGAPLSSPRANDLNNTEVLFSFPKNRRKIVRIDPMTVGVTEDGKLLETVSLRDPVVEISKDPGASTIVFTYPQIKKKVAYTFKTHGIPALRFFREYEIRRCQLLDFPVRE